VTRHWTLDTGQWLGGDDVTLTSLTRSRSAAAAAAAAGPALASHATPRIKISAALIETAISQIDE